MISNRRHIVVIQYPVGQGPPGQTGPPGPGVSYPIDSALVLHVPSGRTVEEILTELLFVPMAITGFTTPQIVFEVGQILTALTFNWGLSKNPLTQGITGSQVTPPTLVPTDRVKTVTLTNLSTNGTITLTVNDGNGPVTSNINISFIRGVFFGSAPIPGLINSAFINTLGKTLQAARQKIFTVSLGTAVYGWYAAPVSYGLPTFKINGFNGGMTTPITVPVTNGFGDTVDYYVSRTENPSLGVTTIEAL